MCDDRSDTKELAEPTVLDDCAKIAYDSQMTPLEKWMQKSPELRKPEIDYLVGLGLGNQLEAMENGDLQCVFKIGEWFFLMVLSASFPQKTQQGELPMKVCLVVPSAAELRNLIPKKKRLGIVQDSTGVDCLAFEQLGREYAAYLQGQHDKLLTQALLLATQKWVATMLGAMKRGHPRCKKVVLSDRAHIQIFNESQSRIETETGGLLLGHFEDGVWYVVEASDPGINAKFYTAYHEGDDIYQNHLCGVISRTYKHPLVFLGMWHRHPGSMDRFSSTDDRTNYKYAASAGNGCISAIINYDPDFRITFYYVEQGEYHSVHYTQVDIEIGDDKISNKEICKIASLEDVLRRQ